MSTTTWIVLGVIVLLVLWIIVVYNGLVAMRQRVSQDFLRSRIGHCDVGLAVDHCHESGDFVRFGLVKCSADGVNRRGGRKPTIGVVEGGRRAKMDE